MDLDGSGVGGGQAPWRVGGAGSADLGGGRLALDHRVIDVVESILVRERVWPLELREGQLLLLMLLLHLLQEKQHG